MSGETKTQRRRRKRKVTAEGGLPWNGGKWIRPEKRLRIYERDGWRCVWCTRLVTNGKHPRPWLLKPTEPPQPACLDHVLPRTRGGSNDAGNLVTSCCECNEKRGEKSAIKFAFTANGFDWSPLQVANRAAEILDRVIEAMGRELPAPVRKPAKAA